MEICQFGSPYHRRSGVVLGKEQEARWSLPSPPTGHVHLMLSTLQSVTVPVECCVHELTGSSVAVEPEALKTRLNMVPLGTLGHHAVYKDAEDTASCGWRGHRWRTVEPGTVVVTRMVSHPSWLPLQERCRGLCEWPWIVGKVFSLFGPPQCLHDACLHVALITPVA